MAECSKKLKSSDLILSFLVCSNRNRSALVRELLSNNSLFVGQLYEDKSLALRARDLIFFYNRPPNSELLLKNSLLELIYFLIKNQRTNGPVNAHLISHKSYKT